MVAHGYQEHLRNSWMFLADETLPSKSKTQNTEAEESSTRISLEPENSDHMIIMCKIQKSMFGHAQEV